MFGKGIYFTDTFEKSYAYTESYTLTSTRFGGFGFEGGFGNDNKR